MSFTNNYPTCLAQQLETEGIKQTGDIEWDRALLKTARVRNAYRASATPSLNEIMQKCEREKELMRGIRPDLGNSKVLKEHAEIWLYVANEVVLEPQRRKYIIDDNNRDIIRFLLYYFNGCPKAEEIFPGRGYKLHKNIMLMGNVGTGKTLLMQIFSEYLRLIGSPMFFHNVSVTQMVNHYSIHNNIDLYTYNESGNGFRIKPENLCLNDIGVENRPFYGIDTLTVVNDFLHARNELWSNSAVCDRRFAHLTTNLDAASLKKLFSQRDKYGRVVDRFKTYNVIPLTGDSRR